MVGRSVRLGALAVLLTVVIPTTTACDWDEAGPAARQVGRDAVRVIEKHPKTTGYVLVNGSVVYCTAIRPCHD